MSKTPCNSDEAIVTKRPKLFRLCLIRNRSVRRPIRIWIMETRTKAMCWRCMKRFERDQLAFRILSGKSTVQCYWQHVRCPRGAQWIAIDADVEEKLVELAYRWLTKVADDHPRVRDKLVLELAS